MADEDTRRLIPVSVKKLDDNLYSIEIEGGESYKVECDYDSIKKVFRRIKAKDGCEHGKCRSSKVGTYASMLGDENNTDLHKINVWKSKIPHDPQSFMKLCESKEEDINMKQIKLTKNYIIEGKIFSKGTVITLKEKLDFLPTDIWEKAKEITDEHERFEFVKAELNKLGDDYSDDEIEDFINKYKTELNESEDDIKPYVNVDNLHFGYNTKYGFIEQGFRKNIIVKNNGKDKTFIFGEVSPKEYAYVVTDVLKGEGDLLEYDVSFKKDAIYYAFENILKDNKITESLKEKEVEGLDDMLDMLEETMESEDKVAKEDIDKVLDVASDDKELLDKWEALSNATDKQFNKRENDFWNRFDEICAKIKKDSKEEK
jgi:hypothetical protein